MTVPSDHELQRQISQLTRGCEGLYTQAELQQRLIHAADSGRRLRIKLGLDPTAPDIHLGHTVVLRKVRQFQDLGHKAVIIIGDYTARIGDPSGMSRTRPVLLREQIDAHAATYIEQAGLVLDTSPGKLEMRKNSEWLAGLNLADILRLTSQMTVARMMERDTFERRYRDGVPIGIHEFLYPLMQGYDSVCIRADVELGGTDQTFNNLVGRQLQANAGQPPQIVMIMPILVGLDGVEKMSKSLGNYIAVTDEPNDMFGKVMSIPDKLMSNYFTLLTELGPEEIDALLDPDQMHPRDAKVRLGKLIVEEYHGPGAAEAAAAEFDRVFSQGDVPTDMPEVAVPGRPIAIVDLIVGAGLAESNSKARRLVEQNAVSIDGAKVTDINAEVTPAAGQVLKVGKRRFAR
ncbi:MAG: tyrosine--tRNA ligase, partial [Phycisphaerae bacterium]